MQNKRGCKPFPTARECRRQALSQKRQRKQNFPSTCVTSPIPMHYKTYTQNHVCKNVRNRPYSAANKAFLRFKQGSFICKTRLFYPATKPYLQHDNASAKPKLHLTNLKTPLFTLRNSCLLHGSRNFFAPQNAYIYAISIFRISNISVISPPRARCQPERRQCYISLSTGKKMKHFLRENNHIQKRYTIFAEPKTSQPRHTATPRKRQAAPHAEAE